MVRRPPGFTLIEAAIVFALMAALMTLVSMYFVRGQRYQADTETYATVQKNSSVVLRKVTSDLYTGTVKEMQVSPAEDAVWFLSSRPNGPDQPFLQFDAKTGKIVWRKWVCYYYDSVGKALVRAEVPLDPPDSELLMPPTPAVSLAFFQTSPSVTKQPVGRRVNEFRVGRTTKGVIVSLSTQAEAPLTNTEANDRLVQVQISSEVTLIN